ncbi:exocyst complex component 7 isoform X9 [Balaenoptera acutorostrata]|uniref:Exocyst complex component 7 n=1 Tax=Balaenoptera acutorostrata TaxID=9767 RepID=A0ABM3SRS0_BALAC|nr:exocyst complex component 7 isoform X9 [Balaenoptera acutorostrata]
MCPFLLPSLLLSVWWLLLTSFWLLSFSQLLWWFGSLPWCTGPVCLWVSKPSVLGTAIPGSSVPFHQLLGAAFLWLLFGRVPALSMPGELCPPFGEEPRACPLQGAPRLCHLVSPSGCESSITSSSISGPCLFLRTIRKAQNLLKQYSQHGLDGKKGGSNLIPLEGHEHDFRVKHLSEALNDKHGPLAGRDDMLDVETDAYIHCVSAFVKLAQSEYQLLMDVIPEHHQKKTFDSLIQDALDGLMLEGENIVAAARKAIIRHDFSAVLTVFPILRHLKQTKPEFDQVLQGTAASTKNKLPSLITSMETVGAKALEDFADNIKNDPDKEYNMPKDGTVHELTSNAILFLQQLLDFQETAGAMLASQVLGDTYNIPLDPRETSSSATSYSSEFSKRLLSTYICKVLGNLQLNLLSKSKVYEDPALSAIFLHNNYNYILKALEKSELIQLVAVTQKTAERSYREHIEQQIQTYQRSWLKVTDYIAEKNLPVFQPGVKLRDKERQMIKERFKGFNDGLEELCKIQKAWAIPDTEQRDKIRQAQKNIVKETYGAFLHRYGSVPFTKNPEKYIKYRVEQVGDMIDRLFDTSA